MKRCQKYAAVGLLWVILSVGCSKDPNAMHGIVKLDGVPVQKGRLILTPDVVKGNSGKRAYMDIKNGKFVSERSLPITRGANVAIVSVHPLPDKDNMISLSDIGEFKMYMVDVDVPAEGTQMFEVLVSTDRSKNKKPAKSIDNPQSEKIDAEAAGVPGVPGDASGAAD